METKFEPVMIKVEFTVTTINEMEYLMECLTDLNNVTKYELTRK